MVSGVSRSATIVTSYLMKLYSWTFTQASSFLKTRRGMISPNSGFVEQLQIWEKNNYQCDPDFEKTLRAQFMKDLEEIETKLSFLSRDIRVGTKNENSNRLKELYALLDKLDNGKGKNYSDIRKKSKELVNLIQSLIANCEEC
eukprot:TRINITY_DN1746_c0_g1_i2.p1 TRINITY_DN1746_c0_g1~~TRINITY_DN1746_c0_g1_i2.p1  ORF type:complete len:143 (+),score=23.16 TRINITY_DN1746_c0_g1_i2:486-914(+)